MSKRHMGLQDREKLEALYKDGKAVAEIAKEMGINRSTAYSELRWGETGKIDRNGRTGYSAKIAQEKIIENYRRRRKSVSG